MGFATFISGRLRLGDSGEGKSSPSVAVAVSGIALAISVMLLSMAVVLGFKNQIREKVMGFDAQITVAPISYYTPGGSGKFAGSVELSDDLSKIIRGIVPEANVAITLRQPAVLKTDDDFLGIVFRAFSDTHDQTFEQSNLTEGSMPSGKNEIVISEPMARKLRLAVGDKVNVYFVTGETMKTRRFMVSGLYRSNFGEYDDMIAYAWLPDLQAVNGYDENRGQMIEIRDVAMQGVKSTANVLQSALNQAYARGELSEAMIVDTVLHTGANYFNWLDLLDTNVVVILVLMGFVSGFTLISCVFILILERVRLIGLLKALGATNRQIRNIFILLGGRVVLFGMIFGNVISLGLIFLQLKFKFIPLDPKAYYLDFMPVEITIGQIVALNVGVIVLSAMLMLIPTSIISRISPSATMHYE